VRRVGYRVVASLDGYIAGPNGEVDWIVTDAAVDLSEVYAGFDTVLLGRRTYEDRGGPECPAGERRDAMNLLFFLVVGLVAGWLAGVLVKGGCFGLVGDLVVGVIGALLAGWLFSKLGASAGGGLVGSIVVATIGAVVLLLGRAPHQARIGPR
jgi:uncharacterized membrane protein YeaQ/YmgE (transglycosylase-associated protein family)